MTDPLAGTDDVAPVRIRPWTMILAATTVTCEALLVFFATLVAKDLSDVPDGTVWTVGLSVSVACLLVAGLLRKRWGYWLGSALQVLVVLSGFWVPTMFFLGGLFAALWVAALYYGPRWEAATPTGPPPIR